MATLLEQREIERDSDFQDKVRSAQGVSSIAILYEGGAVNNHANRMIWAKQVLQSPESRHMEMVRAVIAKRAADTMVVILGLSDTDLQNEVNALIDLFADGTL